MNASGDGDPAVRGGGGTTASGEGRTTVRDGGGTTASGDGGPVAPSGPFGGAGGEITVHRCTVTVVRRGGWSWGPDPRGLVQQVVDTLPERLAAHFAPWLADGGPDVEITEPVTVTVRPGGPRRGTPPTAADIQVGPVPPAEPPGGGTAAPVPLAEVFAAPRAPWRPPGPADLFAELAERGELDALLALLPDESLRTYARALRDADPAAAARSAAEAARRARPDDGATPSARAPGGTGDEGPAACAPPGPPAAHPAAADRDEPVRPDRAEQDRPATRPPAPRAAAPAAHPATGEVRVWSALPFLLTGPLARVGYLDAVAPALAGARLADDAPLFAAALAYKVLGATGRGWRRDERDSEAAAAFAGLAPPVPEEALTRFADTARPALPVLDGVLALAVCRGHDPADPLLLTGAGGGLLLVDAQGVFPVAWTAGAAGLLPHWRSSGRPPVLVCEGPLPPGTLGELDAAHVPFLTGVRPLRGEPAVRLPWRTPLWTGAARPLADPALAASLPGHTARTADLVSALAERRAVPLARRPALEHTVALAALLGLSTLAWTLWRDRETPDPLLALGRFADLEATVRYEPGAVRVRVPLGRRHADLLRGGLLTDVPDVPWLGGRPLTFTGG
ncbi:hypothetical protein [Streptomyces fradiae]|uniref:hypothetical protein n=1 Tax=Streptomyces fradiae TaxID=1906 RepID=UPI0035BE86B2